MGRENANHTGKYFSNLMKLPEPDSYLRIDLDTTILEKNTGARATYSEIKDYIFTKHVIKVHTKEIAQTKEKYGITERKCYNKPSSEDRKTKDRPLSPEKEQLIAEAFRHFGMIE